MVASATFAQLPAPSYVDNCQPCTFALAPTLGPHSFTFKLKTTANDGRIVTAIQVNHGDKPAQSLEVSDDMLPAPPGPTLFFGGVDINFDGYLDLMLITRRGVANAYADYWLYDPKTDTFTKLGNYPVFAVDPEKRRLTTYERGGSGGAIFETREYAFLAGELTLIRDEKQEPAGPNRFKRTVRERKDGAMKVMSQKIVIPGGNGR